MKRTLNILLKFLVFWAVGTVLLVLLAALVTRAYHQWHIVPFEFYINVSTFLGYGIGLVFFSPVLIVAAFVAMRLFRGYRKIPSSELLRQQEEDRRRRNYEEDYRLSHPIDSW